MEGTRGMHIYKKPSGFMSFYIKINLKMLFFTKELQHVV